MENANRKRVKRLAVAATLTALALLLTPRERGAHVLFLPMVGRSADARFGLSSFVEWDCCRAQEQALGLVEGIGYNPNEVHAENLVQMVTTQDYLDHWTEGQHWTCVYPQLESACRDWMRAHPGKYWIIGNEPEGWHQNGGLEICLTEIPCRPYAEMFYRVSRFIRDADPTAKILVAAWSSSNKCDTFARNESSWIDYYRATYGEPGEWWALHYYGYTGTVQEGVQCFIDGLKAKGIVPHIVLSEVAYAWQNADEARDTAWIEHTFPQLKRIPELVQWNFWQPTMTLFANGVPNAAGEMYRSLAQ